MLTKDVMYILPNNIKKEIEENKNFHKLQEIRIKADKPLFLVCDNKEYKLNYIATIEDIKIILQRISSYSIYAFEDEIKQGYITIQGGHRVGLCGSCVIEKNLVKTIKNIASINIRIAREVIGCSGSILPHIIKEDRIMNTIIISPPKCGKTTILRDLVRSISDGNNKYNLTGKAVSVIDERSEIGSCYRGIPQMDIGLRTDILDNCPKSEGIIMAIRSMAPQVVACDEIGTYKDMESIIMALNSGVSLITTIHGFDIEDLYRRPVFKEVIENKVFERAVVLSNRKGIATIEYIYDFTKGEKVRRDNY
jgi:stage III sporulation protein AA